MESGASSGPSAAPSLEAIAFNEAAKAELIREQRRAIDVHALTLRDCERFSALPFEDARGAWLESWCALRTGHYARVLEVAPRALRYFELAGHTRRVIELHLIEAFAASMLQRFDDRKSSMELATHWLHTSREPLLGPLDDAYAGDLPFLLAVHHTLGESVRPFGFEHDPTLDLFASIAEQEYRAAHADEALPSLWRVLARESARAGDVRAFAAHVERALWLDAELDATPGLLEDLELVAAQLDTFGERDAASTLLDFTVEYQMDAGAKPPEALAIMSVQGDELRLLLESDRSRHALLSLLRSRHHRHLNKTRRVQLDQFVDGFRDLLDPARLLKPGDHAIAAEVGSALAERGFRADARRYLELAAAHIEHIRGALGSLALRVAMLRTWRSVYTSLLHQVIGIDTDRLPEEDYLRALDIAGAIKARGLHDLLEGASYEPWADKARARRAQASLAALPDALGGEQRVVIERALSALSAWTASRPSGVASRDLSSHTSPPPLDEAALPEEGSAAIEYILGERTGYAIVLTSSGELHARKVAGVRELTPLWEVFREGLVDPALGGDSARVHHALAERLYVALIAPIEDIIVDEERLTIAPDGLLHELPFEALAPPTRDGEPERYLFMDHEVAYVPSLAVRHALRTRHATAALPPARSVRAMLLGAPSLDRPSLHLVSLARALPGDGLFMMSELFDAIPESEKEIEAIEAILTRRAFSVDARLGEHATEDAVRARSSHLDVLHIATHGLSDAVVWNDELELELGQEQPVLLLATAQEEGSPYDGILTLDEVLAMDHHASLVVLSGCTTGRGWRALGEGAYGFAGAFLYAGIQQVVATNWSISDRATRELMTRFYEALDPSLDAAGPLNTARRSWYAAERAKLEHVGAPFDVPPPFYWASFRVLGAP